MTASVESWEKFAALCRDAATMKIRNGGCLATTALFLLSSKDFLDSERQHVNQP
jgi:hypothetical protein